MPDLNRDHPRLLSPEAYTEPNRAILITLCTKGRRPLFTVDALARLTIAATTDACRADDLDLIAYCLMPDHVHLVVATRAASQVERFVRRLKSVVTQQSRRLGIPGPVWERSYWDRHAREEEDLKSMVEYVLANPVRRGLCRTAEEWPYGAFVGLPW